MLRSCMPSAKPPRTVHTSDRQDNPVPWQRQPWWAPDVHPDWPTPQLGLIICACLGWGGGGAGAGVCVGCVCGGGEGGLASPSGRVSALQQHLPVAQPAPRLAWHLYAGVEPAGDQLQYGRREAGEHRQFWLGPCTGELVVGDRGLSATMQS